MAPIFYSTFFKGDNFLVKNKNSGPTPNYRPHPVRAFIFLENLRTIGKKFTAVFDTDRDDSLPLKTAFAAGRIVVGSSAPARIRSERAREEKGPLAGGEDQSEKSRARAASRPPAGPYVLSARASAAPRQLARASIRAFLVHQNIMIDQ